MRYTAEQATKTRQNAYLRANGSIDTEALRQHARRERARVVGACIDRTLLPLVHEIAKHWRDAKHRLHSQSAADGRDHHSGA